MIGIDIGSYGVKIEESENKGENHHVSVVASTYNPVGHYLPTEEKQYEMLIASVKTLLTDNKLIGKKAAFSLPESSVFSSIIEMPSLSDTELSSAIQWEAEQHLPVSLDSVNLEYTVLDRPGGDSQAVKMKVLLVAAKKELVERIITASQYLEMEIVGLEPGLLAIGRSYTAGSIPEESALVCNLGALSTDLMILRNGYPAFMHSVPTGGLALTRAVEKGLGLQPSQAEEYKRTYGLGAQHLEGKVAGALIPIFGSILAEVRKSIQFYHSESGAQIHKVVLYGGGAYLPDLASYITQTLGFEAVIANPFEKFSLVEGVRLPKETASFGVALGLSMREDE